MEWIKCITHCPPIDLKTMTQPLLPFTCYFLSVYHNTTQHRSTRYTAPLNQHAQQATRHCLDIWHPQRAGTRATSHREQRSAASTWTCCAACGAFTSSVCSCGSTLCRWTAACRLIGWGRRWTSCCWWTASPRHSTGRSPRSSRWSSGSCLGRGGWWECESGKCKFCFF